MTFNSLCIEIQEMPAKLSWRDGLFYTNVHSFLYQCPFASSKVEITFSDLRQSVKFHWNVSAVRSVTMVTEAYFVDSRRCTHICWQYCRYPCKILQVTLLRSVDVNGGKTRWHIYANFEELGLINMNQIYLFCYS